MKFANAGEFASRSHSITFDARSADTGPHVHYTNDVVCYEIYYPARAAFSFFPTQTHVN